MAKKDQEKNQDKEAEPKSRSSDENRLNTELAEKEQKIEELTEMCKRIQAEFINYKNRTEKDARHMMDYSSSDVIKKMLPVLDSFELAFKNNKDYESFKKGVELVYAQLMEALKNEGLRPILALGEKFDPYKHEVLMKAKSDKPEDIVLEELQKGYMFKDKVLRHSKVKISG